MKTDISGQSPFFGFVLQRRLARCLASWLVCVGVVLCSLVICGSAFAYTCSGKQGICACSGPTHGTCVMNDVCQCTPNWIGAECQYSVWWYRDAVSPSALDFGTLNVGSASVPQVVTYHNTLDQMHAATDTTLVNITLGGSNPGDFSLGGTCAANPILSFNQKCTITVTFTPGGLGSRSATLTVKSTYLPSYNIPVS